MVAGRDVTPPSRERGEAPARPDLPAVGSAGRGGGVRSTTVMVASVPAPAGAGRRIIPGLQLAVGEVDADRADVAGQVAEAVA